VTIAEQQSIPTIALYAAFADVVRQDREEVRGKQGAMA
jgi:hypothetical protein